METVVAVSLAVLLALTSFCARASSSSSSNATSTLTLHNTTMACLRGPLTSSYLSANCTSIHTSSLVVIHRVLHGLTPLSSGCSSSSSKEACCPGKPDPSRDCVFLDLASTESLRRCNGHPVCSTSDMTRASVGESCAEKVKDGLTYDSLSYFALAEFSCVDSNLLSDVCAANKTMSGQTLYLDSNFYHKNDNDLVNGTCSCLVLTTCPQTLVFEVLQADLNPNLTDHSCTETLVLSEGAGPTSGTPLATLNCNTSTLAAMFRSRSNVVSVDLKVSGQQTGRLLVRVTATGQAAVEVMCGVPGSKALLEGTACDAADTTTAATPDLSSPTFNTTKEACLSGVGGRDPNYDFEITCLGKSGSGLISVERVFHGVTPQALGCGPTAGESSCCPGYQPARDCLFTTAEGLAALRKSCDGYAACTPRPSSAYVPAGGCPPRGNFTYRTYSSFAFVEYSCINVGLMSDVCDAGNTVRNHEVYLDTNVYHVNDDPAPSNCSCVVSTVCGQSLLFYPMQLELFANKSGGGGGDCLERVTMVDASSSSVGVNVSCDSNKLDEVPASERSVIFQSQSNVVNFTLHFHSHKRGKFLFKVVASGKATVEIRCGRSTALPLWQQHQCTPPPPPSPPPTPTPTPTPTLPPLPSPSPSPSPSPPSQSTDLPPGGTTPTQPGMTVSTGTGAQGEDSDRETIIAIVAGVVASLVVIVFIIIIIVICRGRKSRSEPVIMDDMNVYYEPNPYEDGGTVIARPSDEVAAYENRTYDNVVLPTVTARPNGSAHREEKHAYERMNSDGLEGAVGGMENPVYAAVSYDMENVLNETKPPLKE